MVVARTRRSRCGQVRKQGDTMNKSEKNTRKVSEKSALTAGVITFALIASVIGLITVNYVSSTSEISETNVLPINDEIALEKTTLTMNVPNDN